MMPTSCTGIAARPPGQQAGAGARHPCAEVGVCTAASGDPVDEPWGSRRTAMPVYCAATAPCAPQDVRHRAHRQAHARGAVLDQVDGQLGAGVARADDEDVLAGVGRPVAVVPASTTSPDSLAGQASPARGVWLKPVATTAYGAVSVVPSASVSVHDALRAGRRGRPRWPEAHVEPVVGGIQLEVAHDVVAGDPAAHLLRDREARKAGEFAVCAGAAGRSGCATTCRRRCPVRGRAVQATGSEGGGDGQATGPAPMTTTSTRVTPAKATHPGWIRGQDQGRDG